MLAARWINANPKFKFAIITACENNTSRQIESSKPKPDVSQNHCHCLHCHKLRDWHFAVVFAVVIVVARQFFSVFHHRQAARAVGGDLSDS